MLALIGLGVVIYCILSILTLPIRIAIQKKLYQEALRKECLYEMRRHR